ncbi:MAG: hypothetical protein RIQ93_3494, partial [Verrucomicrobiota bacterium]
MGVEAEISDLISEAESLHSVMRAVTSPPLVAEATAELEEDGLLVVVSLAVLLGDELLDVVALEFVDEEGDAEDEEGDVADEEAVGEVLEVAESLEGLGVEELVAVSLLAAEVVSLVERPV